MYWPKEKILVDTKGEFKKAKLIEGEKLRIDEDVYLNLIDYPFVITIINDDEEDKYTGRAFFKKEQKAIEFYEAMQPIEGTISMGVFNGEEITELRRITNNIRYYKPKNIEYNNKAPELDFIMEKNIAYPVEYEIINNKVYLKKIGIDDNNYYAIYNNYYYALYMYVEYFEKGERIKSEQTIYFKNKNEMENMYNIFIEKRLTPDGGRIFEIHKTNYYELTTETML